MLTPRLAYCLSTLLATNLLYTSTSYAQWYNPWGDRDKDGCGSWDITCNPNVKGTTKPIVEDLWGEAGQAAYKTASEIMYRTNGSSRSLDDEQKKWLRPLHGSPVDRVSVIYNSRMMERWGIPGTGKDIVLRKPESEGQTYCNRIYIRDGYKPGDINQIYLLAHELEHSAQCERLGGMGKFGWHYFREYKRAGLNYENNKLEKEANAKADLLQNPGTNCSNNNVEIRPSARNLEFRRGREWNTCSGYKFIFQHDGNLVLYNRAGNPIWATGTNNRADLLAVQADGNIVLYGSSGVAWASGTSGNPGAFLAIQWDGNLVVYSRNGNPVWSSNTYGR
jgi:hypothetical protein